MSQCVASLEKLENLPKPGKQVSSSTTSPLDRVVLSSLLTANSGQPTPLTPPSPFFLQVFRLFPPLIHSPRLIV